jgi:hypothetical protein
VTSVENVRYRREGGGPLEPSHFSSEVKAAARRCPLDKASVGRTTDLEGEASELVLPDGSDGPPLCDRFDRRGNDDFTPRRTGDHDDLDSTSASIDSLVL